MTDTMTEAEHMNPPSPPPPVRHAGVIGNPVSHSLSPRLHGYWLKHHGIQGKYTAVEAPLDDLAGTLKNLKEKGWRGVNITLPFKEEALQLVDAADDTALRAGAVNTIVMDENGMTGSNTDIFGFIENIRASYPSFSMKGKTGIVVGAGGASRAICVALEEMGAKRIHIINRTRGKAEKLAQEMSGANYEVFEFAQSADAMKDASLLVNASPLGMRGKPPLHLSLDALPPEALVTDAVYTPLITGLLYHASQRGNRVLDGLGMLLHQARPGFKEWFGVAPEVTPQLREAVLAS